MLLVVVVNVFLAGRFRCIRLPLKTQRAAEDARRHDGSWQLCFFLTLSRYDRHVPRALLARVELIDDET